MTLANMSAELGAQVGLVAPDETTRTGWPRTARRRSTSRHGTATTDAPGARHVFDAGALAPQVALPHSPANVRAWTNSRPPESTSPTSAPAPAPSSTTCAPRPGCSRGAASRRHVHLLVAPASVRDAAQAESEGVMRALVDAGATLLPSACGACAGYGSSIPEGSTVISSTARNFKGRMGAATAQVYLGSPYTVAASAVRGAISDAREMLAAAHGRDEGQA